MMPFIQNRQRKFRIPVRSLLVFAGRVASALRLPEGEFTLLLANDRRIRQLNREFRRQDKPTDVLSFPCEPVKGCPGEIPYFGDVIISVETAHRQGLERGNTLEQELKVLLLHGWLHLLGYDHETDQGQMRRKEKALQKRLLA